MGIALLTPAEIAELLRCLHAASHTVRELREKYVVARHVQYPKIPGVLSESIAVFAITAGKLLMQEQPLRSIRRGGQRADILAETDAGVQLRIEVKASGPEEFATFGPKDYAADYLLWMLFEEAARNPAIKSIHALTLPHPKNLPWRKTRVTVQQLLATGMPQLIKTELSL